MHDQQRQELAALLARDVDRNFGQLMLAYQHQLYGFALRQIGNAPDAEDIVQETFMRAYHALQNYPTGRIETLLVRQWLYKIALNVVRSFARRREPEHLPLDLSDDSSLLEIQDQVEEPEQIAYLREQREELAMHLSRLPERYRVAVDLHYCADMSHREIAELLNQPVGTVKANIHRGIRLLRKALGTPANERG